MRDAGSADTELFGFMTWPKRKALLKNQLNMETMLFETGIFAHRNNTNYPKILNSFCSYIRTIK